MVQSIQRHPGARWTSIVRLAAGARSRDRLPVGKGRKVSRWAGLEEVPPGAVLPVQRRLSKSQGYVDRLGCELLKTDIYMVVVTG